MKSTLMMFFVLIVSINELSAERSYIKDDTIGKPSEYTASAIENPAQYRPIEQWLGEKFIFLPKRRSLQKSGYLGFRVAKRKDKYPAYKDCVGRIGTITKINSAHAERIMIRMDDIGQVYTGIDRTHSTSVPYRAIIDGIAPVADIEHARKKWTGQTLWYLKNELKTYDKDKDELGNLKIKKLSSLQVVDVVASWYSERPLRFILKTNSNEEGFVDINLSGTNVQKEFREKDRFEEYFSEEDPQKTYKWSSKIWSAVIENKVFIGMTDKQALMSWGRPVSINKTIVDNTRHEQWVYRAQSYLYFTDGVLTAIQQ